MIDNEIITIDIEKYAKALNNLIGVDSAYLKGDKDVDAIVEIIAMAKKMERIINCQKAEIERLEEEITNEKRNIKFKTGDYAKIVSNHSGHQFEIGTIVKLEKGDGDYKAFANNDYWWVIDVDLMKIDNSTELPNN